MSRGGRGQVVPSFRRPTLPVTPSRCIASLQYRLQEELVMIRSSGCGGPLYVLKGEVSKSSAALASFS
jgi:hypothetical protein